MVSSKIKLGALVIVILAVSIYIYLPGEVKILVEPDKTTFYIWADNSWQVGGVEYSKLYNGTRLVGVSSRIVQNSTAGNYTNITRMSGFSKGTIADNYIFNGNINDKELFPVEETHTVTNESGLIYQYEVQKLIYSGETRDAVSGETFGRSMKIKWEGSPYYARITKLAGGYGKLTLKFRVESNYEVYNIRLFDPTTITGCANLTVAGTTYQLTANILNDGNTTCMNISANNVTLDCQGYTIDGIDTSTSRGIDIKRGSAVTTNITIANCNITDWGYALYITSGNNNRIVNTTIGSNIYGSISILLSSGNNITNVTTKSNPVGFYLSGSNNNILSNNIDNSSDIGFDLDDSQNTTMTNNRMINTPRSGKQGLRILCTTVAKCRENISENNTINDIPILYVDGIIKLCPNNIIYTNGSSYGYMGFVGCNNITVTNSSPTNGIAFAGITNSTISNLNMSYSKRPFIIMAVSKYNNIINNTISNNDVSGILLYYSSNNVFINNTLHSNKPYSVDSDSGYNDTFIGGSVAMTTAGNFDYWLRNGGSNNTFTSTNMTTLRNIYLNEITTYFIYNDAIDGNIQLKTNILTAAKTIYRKVNNWTQSNISWDESASAALTANYSITNLYPNRAYDIYNFSQLAYTITTSSTGTLNFTINLNTTSRTIQVNGTAATDTCSCPASGNWAGNCADNCAISANCNMQGNNVTITGTGTWIFSANVTNFKKLYSTGGCILRCTTGGTTCFKSS